MCIYIYLLSSAPSPPNSLKNEAGTPSICIQRSYTILFYSNNNMLITELTNLTNLN